MFTLHDEERKVLEKNEIPISLSLDSDLVSRLKRFMDKGPSICPVATLSTTMGEFDIELYWHHAPRTCFNFYELCRTHYYNGITIHKVVRNAFIQSGDPTNTGRGGKSIYGETFPDELNPELKHTGAGVVSMVNAGPDTNTSQFIILLSPQPSFDGKFSIFGRVSRNLNVVAKIGNVRTTPKFNPIDTVKIVRASVPHIS
ncbi:Cyclophilin type peptidyl-prolyl cis-trans isomerase/CLD [Babesia microti strain RI]|uniref:Peptidyl-prolyl cis-trans isomerase n=1 Tax=Babesia microti (strain RI) TaxID=1133968 RepID=A0A1R4AAT5_BABMR|nr:Cyclophilin type peptidyl-prolyl cis-trans isomerase/CLD [Babesia microti strain RI]SJK86097.1 Cyclophilin type peptidyl-prolyl cis-trans isomerase/CLD [Babesia microti strain RI]|eukprot:XP_021338293.1 Cyclophilin type peptidyl-prolyl cis-trans isomerase/CLD [Babesia microti strain RI]